MIVQFALMIAVVIVPLVHGKGWSHTPLAMRLAGILLILAGAWCGMAGFRDLGRNRTPFPKPPDDGHLVQTGIYALIRHPLYAALIWLGFGWSLIFGSAAGLVVAAIHAVFFDAKARCEERWLREKYPAYGAWSKRVKRFIPWIY